MSSAHVCGYVVQGQATRSMQTTLHAINQVDKQATMCMYIK